MSAIAVSIGCLRGRPLPRLGGCGIVPSISGSWGLDSVSGSISGLWWFGSVVSISGSWGLESISGSISGSISVDSCCRYSFITIDRKGVGLLGNLTVHVSPSTVSRSYGPSQCPA